MNVFGDQNLQQLLELEDNVPSIDQAVLREEEEAVYVRFRSHIFYPYKDDSTLKQSFGVFESLFKPDGLMDKYFDDIDPEFRLHLYYDEAGMYSGGRVHAATPVEYSKIDQIRENVGKEYDREAMREDYRAVFSFANDRSTELYDSETGESHYYEDDL